MWHDKKIDFASGYTFGSSARMKSDYQDLFHFCGENILVAMPESQFSPKVWFSLDQTQFLSSSQNIEKNPQTHTDTKRVKG